MGRCVPLLTWFCDSGGDYAGDGGVGDLEKVLTMMVMVIVVSVME